MKPILPTPVALLVVSCLGCGKAPVQIAATAPTTVTVSQPLEREVVDYEKFNGRLEAAESVNLQPQVTGHLQKIRFKPGQAVKAGDLLFEIDPRQYQAEFDRAEGQVAVDQAAEQLAVSDNRRNKGLAAKSPGAITAAELDKYAALEAQAKAQVMASQASAEAAELNLKWTKIYAPITGKIGKNNVDAGNLVNANVSVLANIVSVDPIFVTFDVDEATILQVEAMVREGKLGKQTRDVPVFLGLTTDTEYPYQGTLDYVDPRVDPSTGTRRVRAEFSNKKGILSPGLFAKLKLPLGEERKGLLVTERALGTDQGQKFVYVVGADNKVEYRPVAVGKLENGLRVIDKGITADDWVIVNGVQRVRPGVTVDAHRVPMPVLEDSEKAPALATPKANSGKESTSNKATTSGAKPGDRGNHKESR